MNAAALAPPSFNPVVARVWPVLHQGALGDRMIPTIRSMIVATLLTVTVLVGGFGLFAAFRVNHDPLARLPVATTPFQLASVDSAPRALNFAPEPPRLEASAALRAVATAVSVHDPDQAETAVPLAAAPAEAAAPSGDATSVAAPERVALGSPPDVPPAELANQPASSPLPADPVAASPPADPVAAPAPAETAPPQTTAVAAVAATENAQQPIADGSAAAPEATPPAAAAAAAPETAQPDAVVAATESIAEMPPQEPTAAKTAARVTRAQPDTARQIANRKRLAALRRARRARLAARAQPANEFSGFGQANFQSNAGFQTAQSGISETFGPTTAVARRQK